VPSAFPHSCKNVVEAWYDARALRRLTPLRSTHNFFNTTREKNMMRGLRKILTAPLITLLIACPVLAGDMHSDSPSAGNPPTQSQSGAAAEEENTATSTDAGTYASAAAEVVGVLASVLTAL
jgi:hypothetical protein